MTATQAQLRPVPLADQDEPTRPLEAIAADLGSLVADTAFHGLDGLTRDFRAHCERWGMGSFAK